MSHCDPPPPDAFAAMAIAVAILLDWLVPLNWLPAFGFSTPSYIGIAIAAAGFLLEGAAARTLAAAGTTTRPNAQPTALATTGIFKRSRNPFYLGLLLILLGPAIAASIDWGFITIAALWIALDRLVVPAEERRLAAAFGESFACYAANTRRWL